MSATGDLSADGFETYAGCPPEFVAYVYAVLGIDDSVAEMYHSCVYGSQGGQCFSSWVSDDGAWKIVVMTGASGDVYISANDEAQGIIETDCPMQIPPKVDPSETSEDVTTPYGENGMGDTPGDDTTVLPAGEDTSFGAGFLNFFKNPIPWWVYLLAGLVIFQMTKRKK